MSDPALDAVLNAPDDPALRRILADTLQDRGDPRGELIALQFAIADGRAAPKAPRRVKQLIAAHWSHLAGPLALLADPQTARFRLGFLHAITLKARSFPLTDPHFKKLRAPFARTIRELTGPVAAIEALHPWLRAATVTHGDGVGLIPTPYLESLALPRPTGPGRERFQRVRRATLAHLTLTKVPGTRCAGLCRADCVAGLTSLTLQNTPEEFAVDLPSLLPATTQLAQLNLRAHVSAETWAQLSLNRPRPARPSTYRMTVHLTDAPTHDQQVIEWAIRIMTQARALGARTTLTTVGDRERFQPLQQALSAPRRRRRRR